MAENQRTVVTEYSNRGAYGGENIGLRANLSSNNIEGYPAKNVSAWSASPNLYGDYQPDKNMSQIIWNAGFSPDAQWSTTNGLASSNAGPAGNAATVATGESGLSGSSQNWSTSVAGGTQATATALVGVSNSIAFTPTVGGSGYTVAPTVSVMFDSDNSGTVDTLVLWTTGPVAVISGGAVTGITGTPAAIPAIPPFPAVNEVTIGAPDASKITVNDYYAEFDLTTAHTQYMYSSNTNSGNTGLINITGVSGHWSTEALEPNLEKETDIHVFIRFTTSGSGGADDDLELLIGTFPNDDTYGKYLINDNTNYGNGEAGYGQLPLGPSAGAKHGMVGTDTGSGYTHNLWRLHLKSDTTGLQGFHRDVGEKVTLTGADSGASNAVAYIKSTWDAPTNYDSGPIASIVIVSGGSGYTAGEVLNVTGLRSGVTAGRATAVPATGGTVALTGATVTTPSAGYLHGTVCFTIKSAGNTGNTYQIRHIECYIPNKLIGLKVTRTPPGDIVAGKTVTVSVSDSDITGDFVDTTKIEGTYDFTYVAGDGVQNEGTGNQTTHTYPMDTPSGFITIRTSGYIVPDPPGATDINHPDDRNWQNDYTNFYSKVVTEDVYIEDVNLVVRGFTPGAP